MLILLVEDDERIGSFVIRGLEEEGHIVRWHKTGADGLSALLEEEFDVAIVDIMLPEMDGLELVRRVRSRDVQTPILILSARGAVADRVRGLEAGADDYLPKPFALVELRARLAALSRRAARSASPVVLRYDDLTLDLVSRRAQRGETVIELQPKEFSLLEYLLRNPERVVSKTMILAHVWDYYFDPQTNVVDVLVHRLRKKIDHGFDHPLIHTVRGVGYVLRR
ncbi:MAG TPA: response regulator transcription factor [Polyangiaceae bacterium]|nr:response regulator transcription factor [Polyangiaceae bacterium]